MKYTELVSEGMQAGFSLQEIKDGAMQEYQQVLDAGISEEEARQYLSEVYGITAGVQFENIDTAEFIANAMFVSLDDPGQSMLGPNTPTKKAADFWEGFNAGWQNSSLGLATRGKLPNLEVPTDASWDIKLGETLAQGFGAIPAFVLGATLSAPAAASAGPGAPAVMGAAGGFVEGYTRQALVNYYSMGRGIAGDDFFTDITENITSGIMSGLMGAAGAGVAPAATGPVSKFIQRALPNSSALMQDTAIATTVAGIDISTMATLSAGMEGRFPTLEDFFIEAGSLAGIKGAGLYTGVYSKKFLDLYGYYNVHPKQVTSLIENNPEFKDDMLALNKRVSQLTETTTSRVYRPVSFHEIAEGGLKESTVAATQDEVIQSRRDVQAAVRKDLQENWGSELEEGMIINADEWTGQWLTDSETQAAGKVSKTLEDQYGLEGIKDPRLWVDEAEIKIKGDKAAPFLVLKGTWDSTAVQLFKKFAKTELGKEHMARRGLEVPVGEEGLESKQSKYAVAWAKDMIENPSDLFIRWLRAQEFSKKELTKLTGTNYNFLPVPGRTLQFSGIRIEGKPGENRMYLFDTKYLTPTKRKLSTEVDTEVIGIENRLREATSIGERVGTTVRKTLKAAVYAGIDSFRPLMLSAKKGKMSESYVTAINSLGSSALSEVWINNGTTSFADKTFVGKPFISIMEQLVDIPNGREKASLFLTAKAMQDKIKAGEKVEMSADELNKVLKGYESDPVLVAAVNDLITYQKNITSYLFDAGLLSKEALDKLNRTYKNSIPLETLLASLDPEIASEAYKFNAILDTPLGKRGTPEKSRYMDPVESLIRQTFTAIRAGESNRAKQVIAKEYGRTIAPEDAKKGSYETMSYMSKGKLYLTKVPREIAQAARELDAKTLNALDPIWKFMSKFTSVFRAGTVLTPYFSTRNFVIDQFTAALQSRTGYTPFLSAFSGIGEVMKGTRMRFGEVELSKAAKARVSELDTDIQTKKLDVDNYSRDIQALEAERDKSLDRPSLKTPEAVEIREAIEENYLGQIEEIKAKQALAIEDIARIEKTKESMANQAMEDNSYLEWLRHGGGMASLMSMNRDGLQSAIDEFSSLPFRNAIKDPIKHYRSIATALSPINLGKRTFRGLSLISERSEQFTRVAEFKNAVKQGYTKQEAAFLSREVTVDYARSGASLQALNSICAFLNATIQGTTRIVETVKYRPEETAMNTFKYLVVPSMLLAMVQQDIMANEPESEMAMSLEERPVWEKAAFWHIPVPNSETPYLLKIPKPIGWAAASTMVEGYFDWLRLQGKKEFMESLVDMGIIDHLTSPAPNMLPTFLQPGLEVLTNYSLFTDTNIVPLQMQAQLADTQYRPATTNTAKLISKALLALTGSTGGAKLDRIMSPLSVEHLVRGWTGKMGTEFLQICDLALELSGADSGPVKPAKKMSDLPFFGSFVTRYPAANSFSPDKFNREARELEAAYATIDALASSPDPVKQDKALELRTQLPAVDFSTVRSSLGNMGKAILVINELPEGQMSAEEKRVAIDDIFVEMIRLSRAGLEAISEIKEQFNANQ